MNTSHPSVRLLAASLLIAFAVPAQETRDDKSRLANACNQFAADLHGRLAASGSPTAGPGSIAIALLMLLPGARGATADELHRVLHLPEDLRGERLYKAAAQLLASCGLGAGLGKDQVEGKAQLRAANALWVQRDFEVRTAYADVLRTSFGAAHHLTDFRGGAEAARKAINADVARTTNDRITDLIPAGVLGRDTRLVLTNAMWFKAAWLHPFQTARKDLDFTLADGTKVPVPTMVLNLDCRFCEADAWRCIELMFADSDIRFAAILPRDGYSLALAEQELLAGRHLPRLVDLPVQVSMPRFRVAAAHELSAPLTAMGMPLSFSSAADFSGIAGEPVKVDKVLHQTWIDVDEKGVEAAAATAVVMKRLGAGRPGTSVVFDRPFAFALRDSRTGLLLFVGRVDDPRAAD